MILAKDQKATYFPEIDCLSNYSQFVRLDPNIGGQNMQFQPNWVDYKQHPTVLVLEDRPVR